MISDHHHRSTYQTLLSRDHRVEHSFVGNFCSFSMIGMTWNVNAIANTDQSTGATRKYESDHSHPVRRVRFSIAPIHFSIDQDTLSTTLHYFRDAVGGSTGGSTSSDGGSESQSHEDEDSASSISGVVYGMTYFGLYP